MSNDWIHFDDPNLQHKLALKADSLGLAYTVDEQCRICFDREEWLPHGDLDIQVLDDEFGPEWVAAYADDPLEREHRIEWLRQRGIKFVVWSDRFMGTSIILLRGNCPNTWETA